MGLQSFLFIPRDIVEWAKFFESLVVTPSAGTITDDTFASRAALSVIGRPQGTDGPPSDIEADADGHFLVRRSVALTFDGITDADIPSGITRDAEMAAADAVVSAAAAEDLADHVAAPDPHPGYLTEAAAAAAYQPLAAALSRIYTGNGSPESVVTAGIGSLYLRQDGGVNTTLYIKESGAASTGWVAK